MMQQILATEIRQLLSLHGSPYAMVPTRVFELVWQQRIASMASVLYCWMCGVANEQGQLWWSVVGMAKLFSVHPRTVSTWICQLVDCNLIKRERRMSRSTLTTIIGHPKILNELRRMIKNGKNLEEDLIVEEDLVLEEDLVVDDGKSAKTLVHDHDDHDVHDLRDHVESDPLESDLSFSSPSSELDDPDPKSDDDDDEEKKWDLSRLWEIAKKAGFPFYRGFKEGFEQHPDLLETILEFSDEALLWAFLQILGGPKAYFPRTPRYWLVRLLRQAALYREPIESEVEPELKVEPELEVEVPSWLVAPKQWNAIVARIRDLVPSETYERWFEPLSVGIRGNELCLWCPDEFDAVFIEKNFADLIRIVSQQEKLEFSCLRFLYPENLPNHDEVAEYRLQDDPPPKFRSKARQIPHERWVKALRSHHESVRLLAELFGVDANTLDSILSRTDEQEH